MTTNTLETLTSIDTLEQEMADLQTQLRDSIPLLALLNEIPGQFATLAAECTVMNAASATATAAAQTQADQLAAGRAALQAQFVQWQQEVGARETQLAAQWSAFRTATETEQNQVMRVAMTTRQELTDRVAAQEKLVASLDERLEKMNTSLANMIEDLQDARREQKRLAILVTLVSLLALGLGAAASYVAFF